jgi:hypothetical protein
MAARSTNYLNKIDPAQITKLLTAGKTSMVNRFAAWANYATGLWHSVCATLAGEAVKTIEYAHYFAFSNEIASMQSRLHGGDPVDAELTILVDKWVALGLSESICKKVVLNAFGATVT